MRLREWQEAMHLTDAEIAAELGVSRQTWSQWKHGHVEPRRYLRGALVEITRRHQDRALAAARRLQEE
jgi:transcriptional regulator with XRE-family HTH domain